MFSLIIADVLLLEYSNDYWGRLHKRPLNLMTLNIMKVGVAQWSGRRFVAGGLRLKHG